MNNDEKLKGIVREKYGSIARQSLVQNGSACCVKDTCCADEEYSVLTADYKFMEGYDPEADLKLGCGIPTRVAAIRKGDHLLDLGSGAGNDCFIARMLVGDQGKVTGLDFTDEMIGKAQKNLNKTGYKNMEFVKGDIENMPFSGNQYDVVISNCVLNLVPDKEKAFSEIYRVLKPGGHFCVSDIVLEGTLPGKLREVAELYAGCVSGAIQLNDYLEIIRKTGFSGVKIKNKIRTELPEKLMSAYLTPEELDDLKKSGTGIFSVTVLAEKM